jgi:hypothetical protein
MIGNKEQRPVEIRRSDVFDPENAHQIVRGKVYPERTDMTLAKCHQLFPQTHVHPVGEPESDPLDRTQNR